MKYTKMSFKKKYKKFFYKIKKIFKDKKYRKKNFFIKI